MRKYFILLISIFAISTSVACQPSKVSADVVVEIRRAETGLFAQYTLPKPTVKFELEGNEQPQRQDGWTLEGEGWEFDGVSVSRSSGEPFDKVTFLVTPEKKFYDRKYVALDKIGEDSWMIYITAFRAFGQQTRIKFHRNHPDDIVRVGANLITVSDTGTMIENGKHQAYFGRTENVEDADVVLIAGSEIPKTFRRKIVADVSKTITQLSDVFGERPLQKPTLFISTGTAESGRSSKGGLLDDNVMTFHYRGFNLDIADENILESVSNTAAHEATHSWLGGLYKNHRNEEESWAHEGGAEYLADRTRNDKAEIQDELEMRLNACIKRLGDRALDGRDGYVQGTEAYDCGYVLNAFAEAGSVFNSNGNIGDIWKLVFEQASYHKTAIIEDSSADQIRLRTEKTEAKGYTPVTFVREADVSSGNVYWQFANLFLEPRREGLWPGLIEKAEKLGVTIEPSDSNTADPRTLASLWLFPFIGGHCSGGYGYFSNEDHFHLDTGEGCVAALSNKPKVISVDAHNLITDPYGAYKYATKVCAEQGEFVFGLLDGGTTEAIQCKTEVKPIPPRFKVVAMPDLPPL